MPNEYKHTSPHEDYNELFPPDKHPDWVESKIRPWVEHAQLIQQGGDR